MAMGILKSLVGPVTGLVSEFIEDKDKANQQAHDIATLAQKQHHEQVMGQLEVNKVEAASKSMFVAGWRPAVGWVCVLGMAMNFIIVPLGNFGLSVANIEVVIPMIDTSQMMPVLMGMLGLGAMRTVEKVQKVSREK